MTTNTNSPAPAIPQPAGDRESGSPPGSASHSLRERVADAINIRLHQAFYSALSCACDELADAAIAEVMAWRPIETAPKDSRIMLYRPTSPSDIAKVVAGKWDSDKWASKPRPYWSHDLGHLMGKQEERKCAPTHWMPLPSPPNRGEK